MATSRVPKLFKRTLIERYPELRNAVDEHVDTKKRYNADLTAGKRISFKKNCKVGTQEDLVQILESIGGIVVRPAKCSGTPIYENCGFLVLWSGDYYSVLVKGMAVEKPRKAFSPDNIGLGGKSYSSNDLQRFRQDVIVGLRKECGTDQVLFDSVISLLDNIQEGLPVHPHFLKLKTKARNKILCDFGEVVCAFRSLQSGKEIRFPVKSNEAVADFWEDGEIRSVKGPAAGGKLNLMIYSNKLNGSSNIGKFLLAQANHDRESYFRYAALICPWIDEIVNMVGGFTVQALEKFVNSPGSYDKFYQMLKSPSWPGVGIPKRRWESDWRRRWEQERSLDPIWFSIITVMTRWGESDPETIKKISQEVNPLFSTEKFVIIALEGVNIQIIEKPFKDIESWTTHYHSNAGAAWANWPSIKVLEN